MKKIKPSNIKMRMPPDDEKFIINELRKSSVKWSGRREALDRARKKVREGRTKKGKSIWKYHWQCAHCKVWYRNQTDVEVDHIIEIGSFCGDWNKFLAKMFARPVQLNLQVLCQVCHMRKTNKFNAAHLKWKRKRPVE